MEHLLVTAAVFPFNWSRILLCFFVCRKARIVHELIGWTLVNKFSMTAMFRLVAAKLQYPMRKVRHVQSKYAKHRPFVTEIAMIFAFIWILYSIQINNGILLWTRVLTCWHCYQTILDLQRQCHFELAKISFVVEIAMKFVFSSFFFLRFFFFFSWERTFFFQLSAQCTYGGMIRIGNDVRS